MSHVINSQFIHQCFVHASHHRILHMVKLGIFTVLLKPISKLSHNFCACIIAKIPHLVLHPNVFKENLDPGTRFYSEFRFLKKVSCQKLRSALTIVDAITGHLFGYPTRSKRPPLQFIKTLTKFSLHHGYKSSIVRVNGGG